MGEADHTERCGAASQTQLRGVIPTSRQKTLHLASLGVAFALLCWTARGAQFYWDDWAFLAVLARGDNSLAWYLSPHNEHWLILLRGVFTILFHTVGTSSAFPWMLCTLALHIVLSHMLWRLALAGGCLPWAATPVSLVFAVFAAGVENILFVFQMSLVGCLVLGAAVLLELSRPRPRAWVVMLGSSAMVMSFGLAPVLLVLAALFLTATRRSRMLWTLFPAGALFATWYLAYMPGSAGRAAVGDGAAVALYWLIGVGHAVSSVFPWRSAPEVVQPFLTPATTLAALGGCAALLAVALGVVRSRLPRPGPLPWLWLAGGPLVVAVMGASRISFGLGTAIFSRYAYVTAAFLVPFLALAVSRLFERRAPARRLAALGLWALALSNAVAITVVASEWTEMTQTRTRILAAAQDMVRHGDRLLPDMAGTPELAFMSTRDLEVLDISSAVGEPTAADRLSAVLAGQVTLAASSSARFDAGPTMSELRLPLRSLPAEIWLDSPRLLRLRVADELGNVSHTRLVRAAPGAHRIDGVPSRGDLIITVADGQAVLSSRDIAGDVHIP